MKIKCFAVSLVFVWELTDLESASFEMMYVKEGDHFLGGFVIYVDVMRNPFFCLFCFSRIVDATELRVFGT